MEQTLGAGAAAIQVEGDNNTVILSFGTASLVLERPHRAKRPPASERDLPLTDVRSTDLVGRDAEGAAVDAWLAEPRSVACRCLTARAGAGKTRLAIELCERAEAGGWSAGFATQDELVRFSAQRNLAEWRWGLKTLIVVDYAAASAAVLRAWLESLARRPTEDPTLRLLLLERHADPQFGWWADLVRPGGLSSPGPDTLVDPTGPVALPSLGNVEDRRALLEQAIGIAAQIRGLAAPLVPALGADPAFDRRLGDAAIEHEPLYLVMAGIVALTTSVPTALTFNRTDLAFRVAAAERHRLERFAAAAGIDVPLFLHLAACATLQGGCTQAEGERLVADEQGAGGGGAASVVGMALRLATALPSPGSAAVDAVRPDLIGEAFLLDHMTGGYRGEDEQRAIVARAFRRAGRPVITTLIHAAQDFARGDANHPAVMWLGHVATQADDVVTLMVLADEIPRQTVALRELAVAVGDRIADMPRDVLHHEKARSHHQTSWISRLRDGVSALLRSGRAPKRPGLDAAKADSIRAYLALSLSNLSNRLSFLGRREAALTAIEEAVEIRRTLATASSNAFDPDLALSLNNLSNRLSDLGRREAALAAIEEAVESAAPWRRRVLTPSAPLSPSR